MRIYTLWHAGDDGEFPWIVDAVDQYTIDNNGECPSPYLKRRADIDVREMVIDIPEDAVRSLFSAPHVRATVITDDRLGRFGDNADVATTFDGTHALTTLSGHQEAGAEQYPQDLESAAKSAEKAP